MKVIARSVMDYYSCINKSQLQVLGYYNRGQLVEEAHYCLQYKHKHTCQRSTKCMWSYFVKTLFCYSPMEGQHLTHQKNDMCPFSLLLKKDKRLNEKWDRYFLTLRWKLFFHFFLLFFSIVTCMGHYCPLRPIVHRIHHDDATCIRPWTCWASSLGTSCMVVCFIGPTNLAQVSLNAHLKPKKS